MSLRTGHCPKLLRRLVAWGGHSLSHRVHASTTTPAKRALCGFASLVAVGLAAIPAQASDYQSSYSVVRDPKGRVIGTIQCPDYTSQCVTYDPRGRRTGTIDDETLKTDQEPTVHEIIEQERKDEGLDR